MRIDRLVEGTSSETVDQLEDLRAALDPEGAIGLIYRWRGAAYARPRDWYPPARIVP